MTKTKNEAQAEPKAPSHIAYQVIEISEDKSYWNRLGAMWPHGDGKGFTAQLNASPLDGKVVFRTVSEKKD